MKIRMGFVSNSSSSSFMLATKSIDEKIVKEMIKNIVGWEISFDYEKGYLSGTTLMDNFPIKEVFKKFGIPTDLYLIENCN